MDKAETGADVGEQTKKMRKNITQTIQWSTVLWFLTNTFRIQRQGRNWRIPALPWRDHSVSIVTIGLKDLPASAVQIVQRVITSGFLSV